MTTYRELEALGYVVDVDAASGTAAVRGFGVATMIADDAHLDSLADPDAHAERRFQFLYPDAHAARVALEALGYVVERIDPSADSFTVTTPATARTIVGSTAPYTPDGLVAMVASNPAPVTHFGT